MPIMKNFIRTPDIFRKTLKIGDIVAYPEKAHKERSHGDVTLKSFTGVSVPQPKDTIASRSRREAIAAKTMTIEDIQSELKKAIKKKLPYDVIYLVRNNHEIINKEINSGKNSEIINLVDKAANVKATSHGKTAYQIAEDKGNEEFLKIVDDAREKKKLSSEATLESNGMRYRTSSSLNELGLSFSVEDNISRKIHEGFVKHYLEPLKSAVNNKNEEGVDNILLIMTALVRDIEIAEDQNKQLHIDNLHEAIKVTDSEGNTIFQILDSHKNLGGKKSEALELLIKLESIMPNALEATDEEGETLSDVTEKGGDRKSTSIFHVSKSEENFLSWSDFSTLPTNGNNIKTSKKSTSKPSTDQDLHESDSDGDSGIDGSPVSSPTKAQGVGSKKSSRRNSMSSSTGNNAEENSDPQIKEEKEPEIQEEFPPAAEPLPLLNTLPNKRRPKGPSGRSAPSKPLVKPTLVVTPACDAETQKEQKQTQASATRVTLSPQEKEPTLAVIPTPNAEDGPKVVKLEEKKKKGNILLVEQNPAASRNSDKNIPLKKQSNNRSFYFAAIAICTLGAASCFAIAGFMSATNKTPVLATPPVVAIALYVIGIVFVIAAATTWCLTPPPPSSELSPMGLTHQAAESKGVN